MFSEILHGLIDIHVHSNPGLFPRVVDDFQLAEEAVESKMKAVVVKAHGGSSVSRAILVNKKMNKDILIGSIVLNSFVGGLNPDAVDCEIKLGAKIVWMPTICAKNHIEFYGRSGYHQMNTMKNLRPLKVLTIIDTNGELTKETKEIIEILRDNNICMATSHISLQESKKLIDTALDMGYKKIILTHPEADITQIDLYTQKEIANRGIFVEKAYLWSTNKWNSCDIDEIAYNIKQIGAGSCVISTDFGSLGNPHPTEGFFNYINELLARDITYKEIEVMARKNPSYLLGI